MNHQTDSYYIEKVKEGHTQSFNMLVQRYERLVFGLTIKMMKHREEAEEAAQDTFIKAFKSLNAYKGDAKFSTWVYRIAYNTCLDRLKGNAKFVKNVEINEITENQLEDSSNVFESLARDERKEIVQECMNQLPADERAVLHLFYFEENSLKEIAEITALSSNNVKVKLHRARKKLFTIFKNSVDHEIYSHYEQRAEG